ncbi:hypothetical protein EV651_110308 [Kribbella sp. VKM Ac-2571]|nr:hypothetical protein EV651_110308 [Kribbella sp. VKM Ac-2571]
MGTKWEQITEKVRKYALPIVQTVSAVVNIARFIKDFFDL